jgi:hypothetical protein
LPPAGKSLIYLERTVKNNLPEEQDGNQKNENTNKQQSYKKWHTSWQ